MSNIKLLSDIDGVSNVDPCVIWFIDLDGGVGKVSATARPLGRIYSVKTSHFAKNVSGYVYESCASIEEANKKKADWLECNYETLSKVLPLEKRLRSYRSIYRFRAKAYLDDKKHYVYRLLDANSEPVYIGATCDLESRLNYHRQRKLWDDVADVEFEVFPSKASAYQRESDLIEHFQPPQNWRGDKSWDGITPVCDVFTTDQIRALRMLRSGNKQEAA